MRSSVPLVVSSLVMRERGAGVEPLITLCALEVPLVQMVRAVVLQIHLGLECLSTQVTAEVLLHQVAHRVVGECSFRGEAALTGCALQSSRAAVDRPMVEKVVLVGEPFPAERA